MSLVALILLGVLQYSDPDLPVTIRCELDTELPLAEISVSVEEKREATVAPGSKGQSGNMVTLTELPEGDLHLLFYHEASLCGKVGVTDARRGELIRLKVRLVTSNAILLDEIRIRGVSGFSTPKADTPVTVSPPVSVISSGPCPPPGEPITLSGKVGRIIDNDSFELQSGLVSYVVYIGSATRFRGSRERLQKGDLRVNQSLTIKGTVAAGPEGECSIGAKQIQTTR
jgi:hypothetical protein